MRSMTDRVDCLKSAFADRYRIERELGSGGMATVYFAEGGPQQSVDRSRRWLISSRALLTQYPEARCGMMAPAGS